MSHCECAEKNKRQSAYCTAQHWYTDTSTASHSRVILNLGSHLSRSIFLLKKMNHSLRFFNVLALGYIYIYIYIYRERERERSFYGLK